MITKQEVCNYCKSMLQNNIVERPQMVESVLLPVYTSLLLCLRRRLAVILGLATIYDCQFMHLPRYVVGLGFLGGVGLSLSLVRVFFLVWCQCRAKLMAYGCQRSLIMKAPYFWWSQSTFLSSHTKMWNVCVVWPEPTWRWQYEGDWHTLLCSAGMMTNMYTPAMATDCTVHEKIWILKTVSTKQRKQTP